MSCEFIFIAILVNVIKYNKRKLDFSYIDVLFL